MADMTEAEYTAAMSEQELKHHKRFKTLMIGFFISILAFLVLDLANDLLNSRIMPRHSDPVSFNISLPPPVPEDVWQNEEDAPVQTQGTPNDEQ